MKTVTMTNKVYLWIETVQLYAGQTQLAEEAAGQARALRPLLGCKEG